MSRETRERKLNLLAVLASTYELPGPTAVYPTTEARRKEGKQKLNRERRKAVAKVLRSYRALKRQPMEDTAKALGWPLALYEQAEGGRVSLSEGQQNDVRALLQKAARGREGVS